MKTRSTKPKRGWSVFQRGGIGAWLVRYKDAATGRWRDKRIPDTAGVSSKRAAEGWAQEWYAALRAGEELLSPCTTLDEYYSKWDGRRARNPKVRRTTRSNNRGHFKNHISPRHGSKQLSDIDVVLCREFVIQLRDSGLAANTVRNVAATYKTILEDAVDERLLARNPMRSATVRRELPPAEPVAGANVVVCVPEPEVNRLLACEQVPEDRWAQYILVLTGGYRPGELFGLKWRDIMEAHGVPYADITKAVDTNWQLGPPKTEAAIRRVPLHPAAVAALEKWRTRGFVMLVGRAAKPTDPVFPNAAGKHYRPKSAELLREDQEAAGCPTEWEGNKHELRGLRRNFATGLAEADVNEGLRRRLMGHGGAGVTDTNYTAKTLKAMYEAILRLPFGQRGPAEDVPLHCTPANDSTRATGTDGFAAHFAAPAQQTRTPSNVQPSGSAGESNSPGPGIHQTPIGFEDRGPHQRTKRFRVEA